MVICTHGNKIDIWLNVKVTFDIRISKQSKIQSKIHIKWSDKCIFTEMKRNTKTAHWHFFSQNKMVLAHRVFDFFTGMLNEKSTWQGLMKKYV